MKNYLHYLYMITKFSLYGIFIQCVLYTALLASAGNAQIKSVKEVTIDVDLKEIKLKKALSVIEDKTDFHFVFIGNEFDKNETVSVLAKRKSVAEVLKTISSQARVNFKQVNKNISVYYVPEDKPVSEVEVMIQTKTVTGQVTSEDTPEGLPGVNVVLKGTSTGTVTDINGKYSIDVSSNDEVLVFSSVGFIQEEVSVGSQSVINVLMIPDITALEEIVVVGYGSQSRRAITSSIASVDEKEIENIPVTGMDALLQGRAAGVQVVQNSGAPGAENYVRIRGNASLLGQNRPLYIVDGVQMNNITTNVLDAGGQLTTATNDLNPNDIESIEILKDAAATAIYGARASNGVVIITTKSGRQGKAKFSFDAYTGVQSVWRKLDLLDGDQYLDLREEAIANSNALLNQNVTVPDFLSGTGANTNWQDQVFREAPISDMNISMSGGNEQTTYYISLGHFNQEGTIINQGYDRTNGRINVEHKASEKITVGSNLTASFSNNDRVFTDFNSKNPLAAALVFNPNYPVYTEEGGYFVDPNNELNNPVQLAEEITFNSKQKRLLGSVFAELELIEGLKLRSTLGVDFLNDRQQRFIPSTLIGYQAGAEATAANFEQFLYSFENTLTYNKVINSNHSVTAMLGYSILEREETLLRAGGNLAGSNIITTVAISNPSAPDNYITNYGLVSYFGRVNYSYQDKYLLTATLRTDGSSRFGENNRFGTFPAVSAGWRVSSEPFMENVGMINDLKLRVSYGVNGNQEGIRGDFPSLATYSPGSDYLSFFPGIAQSSIANPDLTWEETTQLDFGVDITLLDNRVSIIADVYQKNTDKLLFFRPLPWSSGFQADNGSNIGKMENRGFELDLTTFNLTGDFTWTTSFNIGVNKNEITFLPDYDPEDPQSSDFTQQQPDALGTDGTRTVFRVGESFGSFFGYKVMGVDPSTGFIVYENLDGSVNDEDAPTLGISDRQIFGNALPLHTGGFSNEFGYKGFNLNIFMQWSYGNDIYNQTAAVLENMTGYFNQSADVLDRWQQPGDQTDVPIALFSDATGLAAVGANNREISDRFLEDGSFLRVKDIRLGYTFNEDLTSRLNLTDLMVYASVRNAFTFTDYSGFDPESQNNSVVTAVGVDYLVQPQPRTFIFGIKVGF